MERFRGLFAGRGGATDREVFDWNCGEAAEDVGERSLITAAAEQEGWQGVLVESRFFDWNSRERQLRMSEKGLWYSCS